MLSNAENWQFRKGGRGGGGGFDVTGLLVASINSPTSVDTGAEVEV